MGEGCGQPAGSARPRAPPHCFPLYLPLPPRSPEPGWTGRWQRTDVFHCPLESAAGSSLRIAQPGQSNSTPGSQGDLEGKSDSATALLNNLPWLPATFGSIFAPLTCAHLVPLPGVPLLPCLSKCNPTHSLRSFLLGSPRCPWLGQSDSHHPPPRAGPPWHPYLCLMPSPQDVLPCG